MIFKTTITFLTVILISACANHSEFVNNMNNWVGSDIKTFNRHMGQPTSTTKDCTNCSDNITYVYNFQKQDGKALKKCDIFVNVDGCTIKKISWDGNNCTAYPSPLK